MDTVRFGLAATLLVGTLLLGFAGQELRKTSASGGYDSVAALMEALPTGSQVHVTADVSEVMEDYTSDAGNTYQQFYVTNGDEEVLVFCGTFSGRTNVSAGDTVRVSGEFQKFYDKYEIYTECNSIQIVQE